MHCSLFIKRSTTATTTSFIVKHNHFSSAKLCTKTLNVKKSLDFVKNLHTAPFFNPTSIYLWQ